MDVQRFFTVDNAKGFLTLIPFISPCTTFCPIMLKFAIGKAFFRVLVIVVANVVSVAITLGCFDVIPV